MKTKKFSLIELLVVIAIIGVLASLLLPALGKARKTSQQAVCKSQFKQIGSAVLMYADDNDQYMPTASAPQLNLNTFIGFKALLGPDYLKNSGTGNEGGSAPFLCPSSELETGVANQEAGMAYNRMFGDLRFYEEGKSDANTAKHAPKQIGEIADPVNTGVAADSTDEAATYDNLLPSEDGVGDRHKNGINLLWADGHVQWSNYSTILAGQNGLDNYYYLVIDKNDDPFN
jgi:prepilin-type processing-associated H-X9-DG protein/prepilin-type N-terminal cleavage/methylation domain-containing protein